MDERRVAQRVERTEKTSADLKDEPKAGGLVACSVVNLAVCWAASKADRTAALMGDCSVASMVVRKVALKVGLLAFEKVEKLVAYWAMLLAVYLVLNSVAHWVAQKVICLAAMMAAGKDAHLADPWAAY